MSLTYKVLTTTQPAYLYVQPLATLVPHLQYVTISRPPPSFSLKITNRIFSFAPPRIWNQLHASFRQLYTSAWTAEHLAIWPTTSVLPAAVVLAHGQPPAWCWTSLLRRRHWEIEHLPSPDRVSGTAFLLPSVIRHCRRQSSENCWKLICLFKGRGAGDLWTGALEMYWLTN